MRPDDLDGPDELLAELFVTHDSTVDDESSIPEMRAACLAGVCAVERFSESVPEGWPRLITYRVGAVSRLLWEYRRSADAAPFAEWTADTIARRGWAQDDESALAQERGRCAALVAAAGRPAGTPGDFARTVAADWYVNVAVPRLLDTEADAACAATYDSPSPLTIAVPRQTAPPGSKQIGDASFADVFDAAYADLSGPDSPMVFGDIDSPVDRLGWYQSWEGWPPHPALHVAMDWFEAASLDHAYRERGREPSHARARQLEQSLREHAGDRDFAAVYVRLGEPVFDEGELSSVETFPALLALAAHARATGHSRADEWTEHVRETVRRSPGVADNLPPPLRDALP